MRFLPGPATLPSPPGVPLSALAIAPWPRTLGRLHPAIAADDQLEPDGLSTHGRDNRRMPPRVGDVCPGFTAEPSRCWRVVYSRQLQATHCREAPGMDRPMVLATRRSLVPRVGLPGTPRGPDRAAAVRRLNLCVSGSPMDRTWTTPPLAMVLPEKLRHLTRFHGCIDPHWRSRCDVELAVPTDDRP
jgi:hypothetical protein